MPKKSKKPVVTTAKRLEGMRKKRAFEARLAAQRKKKTSKTTSTGLSRAKKKKHRSNKDIIKETGTMQGRYRD